MNSVPTRYRTEILRYSLLLQVLIWKKVRRENSHEA